MEDKCAIQFITHASYPFPLPLQQAGLLGNGSIWKTFLLFLWMLIYECTRFIIYVWREQKCFNRYMRQRSSTMRWREVSTDCQSEVKAHTCGITRFTTSMWWNLHCLVKMPCSHIKSQLDNTIFHRGIFNGIDEKLKHGPPIIKNSLTGFNKPVNEFLMIVKIMV